MNDTGFKISDASASGWSACMRARRRGSWPIPFELEQNPEFHMGGGGLYGTAGRLHQVHPDDPQQGKGNGNQVLKPETVALMGQNHIGEINVGKMTSAAAALHQRCRSLSRTW